MFMFRGFTVGFMGPAIDSFGRSFRTTTSHPTLILGIFLVMIPAFVVYLLLNLIPIIGPMIGSIVVLPLMLAGVLAMAASAVSGIPSLGDITDGIGAYGASMVGAYAIFYAVMFAFGVVLTILLLVVMSGTMLAASSLENPETALASSLGLLVLFGVVALLYVVALLFVQFVDVAIVVGGASATSAYTVAWKLVTTNPLSAIGYSILRWMIVPIPSMVALAALVLAGVTVFGEDGVLATVALVGAGMLIVLPVIWAWSFVYHATYFDQMNQKYGLTDATT